MNFTEDEIKLLSNFFTNMDKPVFCLKNLPEVVKGALFSRYSRTDKDLRRTLLDEFILKPEMGFRQIVNFQEDSGTSEAVATKKAEEFYDRVFTGFGDDSVAELGGCHIACEDVSNIATKVLEDSRIGLSPLEKSSRYVFFNEKSNGEYKFYRDREIMSSEFSSLYMEICNMLFDNYSSLIEGMKKFLEERYPQGDETDRAYQFTIRAKACDVLRVFLPASALTNVGIFGNGRAYEYLLTKMYAHELSEMNGLAASMQTELAKMIPSFVKRSTSEHGKQTIDYISRTRNTARSLVTKTLPTESNSSEEVTLNDYDKDAENRVVAAILYEYSHLPLIQIKNIVASMGTDEKKKLISAYLGDRQNRRHRPGRAFENTYYTFNILGNYGIYRDLHRHRVLTQVRQDLSTRHGYDVPKDMIEAGCDDKYIGCMQRAREAYDEIAGSMPRQAQYIVPFGFKIRWYITMNLREAFHFCELRTQQQGHADYRRISNTIYNKIREVHPWAEMKFVDSKTYGLERLESEKRIDKKLDEMKKKWG